MKARVLSAFAFSLALAGCGYTHTFSRISEVEPDLPAGVPLVGQWTPENAELAGKDFPVANFAGASLQMTETTYAFAGDRGTYAVVSLAPPARMDIQGVEGPNAGRLIPAIYQINGDDLTVCYQLGPGVRPKDFTSPEGSQILLVHYRRH
ncbi:MAG TPA: TIGR03067 domain-containing protein [Xanthomonadaceae bacterium]|jgi:uncharacterized protein (TIGR03067 family)|nr:TIGR03067 domain-containing protein [Xanthomonadaceae bacterium]